MAQVFVNMWMARRYRQQKMKERKVMRRRIRDLNNPFELHESEFRDLYRISREMARDICAELEEELRPKKSFGVAVHVKVLTAVRLLAVGSYQRGTGQDYLLALGQTTVSKFLRQFLKLFLEKFYQRWIAFPATHQGRQVVVDGFHDKFQFPNVLGCIDCTHVAITTPYNNPESYLNHHLFHSINVQLICDVNGRILHINARNPGRTHDQFIFNHSVIKDELMRLYNNRIGDFHLIGDSGYALEPWMMTPITHAEPGSQEERYTRKVCQTRNIIERTNGVVKATFRSIKRDRVLNYAPETASEIIVACCVLYNMMKHYRVPLAVPEENGGDDGDEPMGPLQNGRLLNIARAKRQRLVQLF